MSLSEVIELLKQILEALTAEVTDLDEDTGELMNDALGVLEDMDPDRFTWYYDKDSLTYVV